MLTCVEVLRTRREIFSPTPFVKNTRREVAFTDRARPHDSFLGFNIAMPHLKQPRINEISWHFDTVQVDGNSVKRAFITNLDAQHVQGLLEYFDPFLEVKSASTSGTNQNEGIDCPEYLQNRVSSLKDTRVALDITNEDPHFLVLKAVFEFAIEKTTANTSAIRELIAHEVRRSVIY